MKKDDQKALLHYLISFTGGFLGVYPVLYVAKSFASAQTVNQISALINLANGNIPDFLLRLFGLSVFLIPIIFTTIIKNRDYKTLAIVADILDVFILILLPESTPALLAVLPNFFAMAFQWCAYDGAYGFTAAPIFSTNNTRQFVSSFVEVYINKNKGYKLKMTFYGLTLLSFNSGVLLCAILAGRLKRYVSLVALIPLALALFVRIQLKKKDN